MESSHLVKVFAILEATAGKPAGMPLAELAALVGLPKSTTHRLLKTLCCLGYMANRGQGVYSQTGAVRRLMAGDRDTVLVSLAEGPMKSLHEATKETVNLGILKFERVIYLRVIETKQTLRRMVTSHMADPLFSTALGRAIAAFLPEERLAFLLRHATLEKRTPHTVVDPARIRRFLLDVVAEGVAHEEEQTDLGVACLAAPIFDGEGVVAAISVSAPTARLDQATLLRWKLLVKQAAQTVTNAMQGTV